MTIFRPEPEQLRELMQWIAEEGLEVLVHVDGPTGHAIEADLLGELQAAQGVTVLQAPVNRGIGAGLNVLAQAARTAGFRRILLFDQDSAPLPGFAFRVAHAFDFLIDTGARPAVVGPRPVAAPGETSKPPRYSKRPRIAAVGDLRPVNYVITSGSLVSLDAIEAVGDFRNDYFIDAIDTEWCFRAWHRGWSVWTDDRLEMPHRVGSGVIRFGPLQFPQQSEARMITYLRNQSHGLRLPHVPMHWKMRFLAYAPLQVAAYVAQPPLERRSVSRFVRAISDGLRARLGPLKKMPEIDKSSPILREDHKAVPVTVIVHVHYADVWEAMAAQVAACMPVPFRLVLTSSLPPRSLAVPPTPLLVETRIIKTENRGRDIRPFLTALGQTDGFSIGLKLHTKRSMHRLDGDNWREAIVNSLLPSRQGVTAIIDAMANDPRIGLVAPQGGLLSIRPWIGRNEPGMRVIGSTVKVQLADKSLRDGHFVAGSMFWFQRHAIADLADPRLLSLFEMEAGQVDGTLAHAAERLFALVAETRGRVTLPVDALPDAHPDMTARELQALSRSTVDRDNPHLRPLPLLFRTVDRYLPFAKTVYGHLHPGIRGAVRKLLLRGPSSGTR